MLYRKYERNEGWILNIKEEGLRRCLTTQTKEWYCEENTTDNEFQDIGLKDVTLMTTAEEEMQKTLAKCSNEQKDFVIRYRQKLLQDFEAFVRLLYYEKFSVMVCEALEEVHETHYYKKIEKIKRRHPDYDF